MNKRKVRYEFWTHTELDKGKTILIEEIKSRTADGR